MFGVSGSVIVSWRKAPNGSRMSDGCSVCRRVESALGAKHRREMAAILFRIVIGGISSAALRGHLQSTQYTPNLE